MEQEITKGTEKQFVFGGNSIFTLQSNKTGNRFTYKVTKAKNRKGLYFAKVLKGTDNDNDYAYLGILTTKGLILTQASKVKKDSTCVKALDFFMERIENIPSSITVYHAGKCCCCGRTLTTPESIKNGYGPECAKIHNLSVTGV